MPNINEYQHSIVLDPGNASKPMPKFVPTSAIAPADGRVLSASTNHTETMELVFNGASYDRKRIANVRKYAEALAIAAAGSLAVWTPVAGKKFRLHQLLVSCDVATVLTIKDGATGTTMMKVPLAANEKFTWALPDTAGTVSAAINNVLTIAYTNTTGNLYVAAIGNEE